MSNILYKSEQVADISGLAAFGAIDSAVESTPDDGDRIKEASSHQVAIIPNGGASGTLKIGVVPVGVTLSIYTFQYLQDDAGADLVIDLADGNQIIQFDAATQAIVIAPATPVTAGYVATFAGW